MNPLRALLEALTPDAGGHAERTRAAAASLKKLREDTKGLRREIATLTARAGALSRQLAQVRALRQGEHDAAARLDDLARAIPIDLTAAHVRAAVERAARVDHPVPRLEIDGVWPAAVYDAMVAAIPDPIFFEGTPSGTLVLRVPPRLAPVADIAAWAAVADIVERSLVPAVALRFDAASASLEVEPGRLVRHAARAEVPAPPARTGPWFVVDIDLSGRNTAVATSGPPEGRPTGEHCSYEVWFRAKETV